MEEVSLDLTPFLRLLKDGSVQRLAGFETTPPSFDPKTNVDSKDVGYSPEKNLSCRLYLPKNTNPDHKLPLLMYFHGGGFCVESSSSVFYHSFLNTLVAEAGVIAVSVNYRLAPENPIPIAYDDSWEAVRWVSSHVDGDGPEEWLNTHADFGKLFFAGDSAGANISHQMAIRVGDEGLIGVNLVGIVLVHPYFWGNDPIGNEPKELENRALASGLWKLANPASDGDDVFINPVCDPKFGGLGCERVLVCVAEKDVLRERGWRYCEELGKKIGWEGRVEFFETKGEDHVFHLFNQNCENAEALMNKIASFLKQEDAKAVVFGKM